MGLFIKYDIAADLSYTEVHSIHQNSHIRDSSNIQIINPWFSLTTDM